jgi:phage/conjugal plasmid C-4 type zinc finger TraR family protein
MAALTPDQIQALARQMDQEAAATRTQLQDAGPLIRPRNTTEAVSHAAIASDQASTMVDDSMRAFHDAQLTDIEAARRRLADGSYGLCTDCGNDIPFARLQAYPTAKRCVECQRKQEQRRKG